MWYECVPGGFPFYQMRDFGPDCSKWFKLLLDANTQATDFDDELLQKSIGNGLMRLPPGKDAREVTTDFLRLVYKHVMEIMRRKFGPITVDQTPFRFMVTIPATWGFAAREATRQAAQDAGFASGKHDELVMIDEPEASAIAAYHALESSLAVKTFPVSVPIRCRSPSLLTRAQKKSVSVIVDAGGGTGKELCVRMRVLKLTTSSVDLISYRVMTHEPSLKLEEACEGQGTPLGSSSIDSADMAK
jgi:hypothetical protein